LIAISGTTSGPELLVELDRRAPEPLHRQLANGLRDAIRIGRFVPETRLPSTRVLAADLGVSRRLVVDAYCQLAAEGFLLSRHGSGTRVATVDAASAPQRYVGEPPKQFDIDFAPGSPDLGSFPRHAWLRALRQGLAEIESHAFGYVAPQGLLSARVAVADYLRRTRPTRSTSCSARERHRPSRCSLRCYQIRRWRWRIPAFGCTG
jgi:GntR family transcriptional regulator / MocR family aminotransferase